MRTRTLLLLIAFCLSSAVPTIAQEESPSSPEGSEGCQVGELCTNVNTDVEEEVESGPINDPPGEVRTSLITLGFIAIFVGTYLFFALSGRSLPRLARMPGRKS